MEQDFITGLYESINGKRIGSEDDFREALKDSAFAKGIYESINGKRIGTFDQFMQAIGGENQDAQTYENTDSQPPQQEPNFNYQPKSQTPLELLANRPTPLIDKKGKSYYKLDDTLAKAEQKVQDEHDNLFEYLGKKITGTASNLLKFGIGPGAGAMSWGLAEAKRSAEERVRVGAAEKERKSLINSINPNDVEAASYKDLYKDIYDEVGDEATAVRKANIAIKQHANRVNEITQSYYDRLKGKEKKAADDIMNGLQTEPLEAPSEDFSNWLDLVDKNSAQSKELNLHTDQYKEALTGILNVIGEAKNDNLSPTETEAAVKDYVETLPYNSPLRTKAFELYEGAVKDAEWSSAGLAQSILNNTLLKGAKTIEAGLETSKWLGNGLSKMFEGFNEANPLNDKGLSDLEKKEAFKSSTRAITQALIDPSSKYTGAISEQVVDKNGRRLVVKDGKVIDIRRPDGTKIFKPTQADIKIAESYDPQKDIEREDYRGKSIAYQAGQVISDMAPMIIIGAASGGTGAAAGATTRGQVLGSALISAGDYYQEGLDATGSVGQAALYAGFTAPMIGYVESKIGNIEAKLGRSIIGAERQGIFEAIKKEGKLIAQQGIESYVKGPGAMARAVKALKKAGEIGNDIKDEWADEFSNFPVEFVGQYISGMDPGPAPKEELEATAILTPLVTLALGGAKLMLDNQRDIDELVGYAALNKDHFEALGQQWIDSSKTDKEKSERTKDFEAKKAAVNEVHDTFNYIDENDFTPKQKDSLLELSFEKARAIYRQNTSNSAKTKADLALKIEAIDSKMSTIMNSETKAADTYLNDEEGVAEPSLITTSKTETQLEKGVDEPKISEPAPVLDAGFDNFLATEGINLETEVSLGDVESRMTNAEYIDVKELDAKADKLYQVWDKVDQDTRLTPETKEELKSKLENLITKLETYELATTDEVSTTTEGGAAKGVRIIGTKKIEKPSRFEVTPERIAKQKATRVTDKNGNEFGGVFEYKGGKLSVQTKNGTIPVDQSTLQFKQSIKENDTVVGAEVYDPSTGHTFTIGNRELALDMAIKAKEMAFGVAEEPLFEEVFSEVTSKTTTTKKLVREGQQTQRSVETPAVEITAPKIETTTDVSQQPNQDKPDNTITKETVIEPTPPTSAELEDDLKNNRLFSKSYNSESEVPEEFKDKIVRSGSTEIVDSKGNKKTVNEVVVSMPLSEYNYRQALKNKNESKVLVDDKKADIERRRQEELNIVNNIPLDTNIRLNDFNKLGIINSSLFGQSLFNSIINIAKQFDIKIRFTNGVKELSEGAAAHFDSNSGTVLINLQNLYESYQNTINNKGRAKGTMLGVKGINSFNDFINYTITHELIHGVTQSAYNDVFTNTRKGVYSGKLNEIQVNAVKSIGAIFNYLKTLNTEQYFGGVEYGLHNMSELMAEMSNEGFVSALQRIQLPENLRYNSKNKNIFENIISFIRDLFTGKKVENNAAQSLFAAISDIITSPQIQSFTESNYTQNSTSTVQDKINAKYNAELANLTTTQNDIKNETPKSGGDTTSTTPNSTEDVLSKQEEELETILEPLGKTQKEREAQIEKFFTSKDSGVDKDTAKEQAKLTARVWQAVAKYFGKRNKQTADEYILSKLKLIGQTPTSKVGDAAKMQGGLEITPQMADQLSANILTHLDTMIEERTNPSKVAKALKENRGLTKADITDQVQRLKEVRDLLIRNGRVSYQMDDIWHGSPHDVDKFSTSKIGTGEGAQAFGWGLYFTDLKGVAEYYARTLGNLEIKIGDIVIDKEVAQFYVDNKDNLNIAIPELESDLPILSKQSMFGKEFGENAKILISAYKSGKKIEVVSNRNLYKVTLNKGKSPDQYTWLEWDKPISDKQRKAVAELALKEGVNIAYDRNGEAVLNMSNVVDGEALYKELGKSFVLGSEKEASLFLLRAGIDGIKYPSESIARGTTSDTARGFNYVVFDENAVTIEDRIKFQNPGVNRGALIEYAKNEMIMVALESPNVSTAIHELYHVFQGDLGPDELQTIVDNYNEAFGTNHTLSDLNGKVATDVEEWGARLWEKYFENGRKLTEKEVPNSKARNAFQNIFDKFTEWMKGVYNGVISYTNTDGSTREVNVSKPVQDMFDKILGITPINEGGGKKSTTTNKEEDLSFLRDMEDFDFENLKTACVKL